MATRDSPGDTPRLRFDKVALRLVQGVRSALEGAVPDGRCVVFTVTAPIREPSKTMAALIEMIQLQLSVGAVLAEHAQTLHGNEVRVRVVANQSRHAEKVAGFVHNPDPPPDVPLNIAQSLLEIVEVSDVARSQSSAAKLDTLRRVCGQVLDANGCAKVVAAVSQRRARPTRE